MVRLNLDPTFTPYGGGISFERIDFPSGCEPHIRIHNIDTSESEISEKQFSIFTRITNMTELVFLFLATDALRRMGVKYIEVSIPFLPFARQDRLMVSGDTFSLKVLSNLINAQNYDRVYLFDVHSDVATALIDRSINIPNHKFVKSVWPITHPIGVDFNKTILVCPDFGAYKKITKLAQEIGYYDEILLCNKVRDLRTGKILRTDIPTQIDVRDAQCIIVDDICDGGATFIPIAEELVKRNAQPSLIVSHGIFSKGLEKLFTAGIKEIHTTDSVPQKYTDPGFFVHKLNPVIFSM